jgi:hypothetical protein
VKESVTEAEWMTCRDPEQLLRFLNALVRERKVRLFACACVRRVAHLLSSSCSLRVLALAEEVADRWIHPVRLMDESRLAREAIPESWPFPQVVAARAAAATVLPGFSVAEAIHVLREVREALTAASSEELDRLPRRGRQGRRQAEREQGCELLREVIGNPFHPVALDAAWQTPAVVSLARAAYDHRELPAGTLDPHRLAVLADALEDTGCDNREILDHLRGPGPHVRGCWVLDKLLGRE